MGKLYGHVEISENDEKIKTEMEIRVVGCRERGRLKKKLGEI